MDFLELWNKQEGTYKIWKIIRMIFAFIEQKKTDLVKELTKIKLDKPLSNN